jgi:hypothetical protein
MMIRGFELSKLRMTGGPKWNRQSFRDMDSGNTLYVVRNGRYEGRTQAGCRRLRHGRSKKALTVAKLDIFLLTSTIKHENIDN